MVTLEDAVIARLEYFGEHFEILVDPDIASEILSDLNSRSFEGSGGIFSRLFGGKPKNNFSAELEQVMKEAKDDDLYNEK